MLFKSGILKFLGPVGSNFSFDLIFVPGSSLVSLNCPFGSQSIKFSLSIRCFFLEVSQFLYLLLLLLFNALLL